MGRRDVDASGSPAWAQATGDETETAYVETLRSPVQHRGHRARQPGKSVWTWACDGPGSLS